MKLLRSLNNPSDKEGTLVQIASTSTRILKMANSFFALVLELAWLQMTTIKIVVFVAPSQSQAPSLRKARSLRILLAALHPLALNSVSVAQHHRPLTMEVVSSLEKLVVQLSLIQPLDLNLVVVHQKRRPRRKTPRRRSARKKNIPKNICPILKR